MKEIKSWSDISIYKYEQIKDVKDMRSLVEILYDTNPEDLPLKEYIKITEDLQFLTTPPTPKPLMFFIDNYNICINVDKMTTAQYIDYTMTKPDDYLTLLSILFVPKNKKYGEYDMVKHKEIISKLVSIQYCIDLIHFFQEASILYPIYLAKYSLKIRLIKMKIRRLFSLKWYYRKIKRVLRHLRG